MMRWRSNGDLYFNPRSQHFHQNYASIFAEMHARGPVHRTNTGVWMVSGYHASREILLTPQLSRIHPALALLERQDHHPSAHLLEASLFGKEAAHDGPIRAAMKRIFTPANVRRHHDIAARRADDLLDALPKTAAVATDFDLALPFTLTVLSLMLGLKLGQERRFREFTERMIAMVDSYPVDMATVRLADEAIVHAIPLLEDAISGEPPPEGTLAEGLRRLVEAGEITHQEAIANLAIAFGAGHDTTLSLIAQTLLVLSDFPEAGQQALGRQGGMERLVEEAMRFCSPVQVIARKVLEDLEFYGRSIRAGDDVMVIVGAANRDPSVFSDPDVFSIDRERPARSIGFGFGIHLCVGEQLARLHAAVLVERILTRFPNFRCDHDPTEWRNTAIFRYPQRSRLTLEPLDRQGAAPTSFEDDLIPAPARRYAR